MVFVLPHPQVLHQSLHALPQVLTLHVAACQDPAEAGQLLCFALLPDVQAVQRIIMHEDPLPWEARSSALLTSGDCSRMQGCPKARVRDQRDTQGQWQVGLCAPSTRKSPFRRRSAAHSSAASGTPPARTQPPPSACMHARETVRHHGSSFSLARTLHTSRLMQGAAAQQTGKRSPW